jgi:alkaline phosphatase isozyme conversion protein
VINLDNLIVGDKLYFNSGQSTPGTVRKLTRDRALAIARNQGVYATSNPGGNPAHPKGTACCSDGEVFDKAGIPVLYVEATNWTLGKKDGYQQRAKSKAFPDGQAGMTSDWIICSTLIARYRKELNTAVAMW